MNEIAKNTQKPKRSPRVNSLTRVVQILDYLVEKQAPQSPYAIAVATNAPVSTVYNTIDEMEKHNIVSRHADGSVWLGQSLYYYGLAYSAKLDIFDETKKEMINLRDAVDETVQICGRDKGSLVVLDMAKGQSKFQVTSDIGTRLPLNWTASGSLLLGHLSPEEREAALRECAQESPTGEAETDPQKLSEKSKAAFDDRLAIQYGEADYMVCCIASPICDADGACIATISIVLPDTKARRRLEFYTDHVKQSAERIERRMGWREK